jgi:hypothetical protein
MEEILVRPKTFAKMTGLSAVKVYNMITPQQIEPKDIDGKKFIDINKYNPKNYSKDGKKH